MVTQVWQHLRLMFVAPLRQLQLSLLLLLCLVAVGTVGYMWLEGMAWIDALYMTIITLTTVGFGEVKPLTPKGRMFTIALIILGVSVAAWAVRNAVEVVLGEQFWMSVSQRRLEEQLATVRDHYIVCGYGRMGQQIVRDLRARREPFVVIDTSPEASEVLMKQDILHIIGDATQDSVLIQAGVERARGLVAALSGDADNVLAVLTARGLNPNLLIVARASSEAAESKLRRAGADRVVSPYVIGGHRLALALLRPAVHDFLNHLFHIGESEEARNIDIGEVHVRESSPFAGQTLVECDLRRVYHLTVIAIQKPDGSFVFTPDAHHRIQVGETLIVIGRPDSIYMLEQVHGRES